MSTHLPTLWRTCRVLASHTRLSILNLLFHHSPLSVSLIAEQLNLALPVTSQALRALEARGLLAVRRVGQRVYYRINDQPTGDASDLLAALRKTFRTGAAAEKQVFRLSTAFTHPRRIEIFQLLHKQPCKWITVRSAIRISGPALLRHMEKLQSRGFANQKDGIYSRTTPQTIFGRSLAKLAAKQQ